MVIPRTTIISSNGVSDKYCDTIKLPRLKIIVPLIIKNRINSIILIIVPSILLNTSIFFSLIDRSS